MHLNRKDFKGIKDFQGIKFGSNVNKLWKQTWAILLFVTEPEPSSHVRAK